MTLATLVVSTVLLQAPGLPYTPSPTRPLGTLRQQAAVEQEWLRYRLDSVLPRLMRQYHVAMWVVPMREYNEDPVFWSLVSATTFFARRRTIYVFYDRGPERDRKTRRSRSEEHTSELQSPCNLVCRLL